MLIHPSHKWVTYLCAPIALGALIATVYLRPAWPILSIWAALGTVWLLTYLRMRATALHWQAVAQSKLMAGITEALLTSNKDLLTPSKKPSDMLKEVVKEMTDG